MTSKFDEVNELLDYFNNYQQENNCKKSMVKQFLDKLKWKFDKRKNFVISGSYFFKIGSSYEDTVANPNADFDVAMILPSPYIMDNFETVEAPCSGLYKLRCTDDSDYYGNFLNSKYYLKVEELQNRIFYELASVIENIAFNGFFIEYHEISSSLTVSLKNGCDTIKIDIAPQIGACIQHGHLPGFYFHNIPQVMTDVIYSSNLNVFFNLSCPPDLQDENYSHLVVQPSFNLLEKECMLSSAIVKESVRIAKAVCKYHGWMKDGIRSFHIKRIAICMYDEIESTMDPWHGYKKIIDSLISMLEAGYIDGGFIIDQVIICRDEDQCRELGNEMRAVVKKIRPGNILHRLGYD